jgi:hypothetical protein
VNNVHRFNYIEGALAQAIRINNQLQSRGTQVYGNIINKNRDGVDLLQGIEGVDIYNNTFHDVGFGYGSRQADVRNVRVWNNIVGMVRSINTLFYFGVCPTLGDYNAYQTDMRFRLCNGLFRSLSDLRRATGLERSSRVVDCRFIDAAAGDFRLQPSSPCKTAGRAGGSPGGAQMELGAYGLTNCVGHRCDPKVPSGLKGADAAPQKARSVPSGGGSIEADQ